MSAEGSGSGSGDARGRQHKYQAVAAAEDDEDNHPSFSSDCNEGDHVDLRRFKHFRKQSEKRIVIIIMAFLALVLFVYWAVFSDIHVAASSCDDWKVGYQCEPQISHYWGQYSPWFSVPSELPTGVPDECKITFAQVLSRHGARDPTASKTGQYNATVSKIQSQTTSYSRDYAFIKDFVYTLQANQLSVFGQQQMINSGHQFYERYQQLTANYTPFVRSSGQTRVVESALNWTQGFHSAKVDDFKVGQDTTYPYPIVTISESDGVNNTLSHGLCTAFELSSTGNTAQATWSATFTPPITARLNKNLPGANLTALETIYMMDLCPFVTVADVAGKLSPFCALFTEKEWREYDYYQTLGKYYGYGSGNALGATQGVGFTNELIARLTDTPVVDHTSTNFTLDHSNTTFPLGKILYADFSHDNEMTAIFAALGLYNATKPMSNTTVESVQAMEGYSAAWTVTFAGRMYVEKMACEGEAEELVRVVVNDRVLPLETCGGDRFGRCGLGAFVDSLGFAKAGGRWDQCEV